MSSRKSHQEKSKTYTSESHSTQDGSHTNPPRPPTIGGLQSPPSPPQKEPADKGHKEWRENLKFGLEIVGLIVPGIHTTFSYMQWDLAHKIYIAAKRPYVGINGISVIFYNANGSQRSKQPTKETTAFSFTVEVKNFGSAPGSNLRRIERAFFGGVEVPVTGLPDTPSTLFPGKSFALAGSVGPPDYEPVMAGNKVFAIEVGVDYDGPADHYSYCEKNQFDPRDSAFINLGPSCTKK